MRNPGLEIRTTRESRVTARPTAILLLAALLAGAGGCEKDAAPPPPAGRSATASKPAPIPAVPAADPAQDVSQTPGWLPAPQELVGWVRTSNATLVTPAELESTDPLGTVGNLFEVKSIVRATYTTAPPNTGTAQAQVDLVEAAHPDDAYGVFTCLAPPRPRDALVGSASCLVQDGSLTTVHGWQGPYYLRVRCTTGQPLNISVEKLAAGLIRPVPSSDAPALLRYLPATSRIPGHLWVVRKHLDALPEAVRKDVLRGSSIEATHALGLSSETLMAVAAYDPGDSEPPNYVWVVAYPTHPEMLQAFGRYKSLLRHMDPTIQVQFEFPRNAGNKPAGNHLCGSWTADQESIMHLLPVIAAGLPTE